MSDNKFDLHNGLGEHYAEVRMAFAHYKKLMAVVKAAEDLMYNNESPYIDYEGKLVSALASLKEKESK